MDVMQLGWSVASGLAGVLLAWAGAAWWYGRKLKASAHHQDKLEASRQLLNQQTSQARRQIEQLQRELAEARVLAERGRARPVPQAAAPATVLPIDPVIGAARATPAEPFPQTQFQPRPQDDFPATHIQPRRTGG